MVECGGLENRFPGNRNGGSNPSPSAKKLKRINNVSTFQYILIGIAALVFFWAWKKGHLLRMAAYVGETKVELRKCNWPTKDELKGATVLVMMSVVAIGIGTGVVDFVAGSGLQGLMDLVRK